MCFFLVDNSNNVEAMLEDDFRFLDNEDDDSDDEEEWSGSQNVDTKVTRTILLLFILL